jgi:hypothetical protein
MNALLGIFPPTLVAEHYAQVFHPSGLSRAAYQGLSCRLYLF